MKIGAGLIQLNRAKLIHDVSREASEQSAPFERPPPPPEARTILLQKLRCSFPVVNNPLQLSQVELLLLPNQITWPLVITVPGVKLQQNVAHPVVAVTERPPHLRMVPIAKIKVIY